MQSIREKLKAHLQEKNMRPAQLAKLAELTTSTVGDILKGKTNPANIGVDKIIRICNVLGITVEYLYGKDEVTDKSLSDDALRIAEAYDHLDARGKATVSACIEQETKWIEEQKKEAALDKRLRSQLISHSPPSASV